MTASFLLAVSSFCLFALSMSRHRRQLGTTATVLPPVGASRAGGWLLLSTSLALALAGSRPTIATVEWIGLASAAAACVVSILTLRASALPQIAAITFATGILALAIT